MLKQLKRAVFSKSLKSRLRRNYGRPATSLSTARRIGIAFDATEPGNYVAVDHYARQLKESGKRVELLGFYSFKHMDGNPVFAYFNKKDLNWYGKPRGRVVDHFISSDFDILINAYTEECLPLEYVSACSQSRMRIGLFNDNKLHCNDVHIKPHDEPKLDQLLNEIDHYLKMIKIHEN